MNHLLRPHLTPKTLSPPIQSHDARCELLLEVRADLRLTSGRQRERKFARRTGIRPVLPRSLVVWDGTIVHPPRVRHVVGLVGLPSALFGAGSVGAFDPAFSSLSFI